MLWLPKTKDILVAFKRPPTRFSGMYKIEAVDKFSGKRRVLADWFPNLITTNGANILGGNSFWGQYCAVGSGNNTPALTDTQLQTLVGSTQSVNTTSQGNSGSSPYYGYGSITYNFPAGTATGNLSEVGVGPSATNLFSRALILNGGGSPTTITVLSSEALYVTYQLNQYVPLTDGTGNVTIGGTSYSYTIRAANATSTVWSPYPSGVDPPGLYSTVDSNVSNGALGAITGNISGTLLNASALNNGSYSTGTFALTSTATWGLANGNASGGITAATFQFGSSQAARGQFQVGFGLAIPKTSSYVLTLSVTNSWTINSP